jgi:CheY-like chemotaxis protein
MNSSIKDTINLIRDYTTTITSKPKSKEYSILIIEDEQQLRTSLVEKFQKSGYITLSSGNGKEAISVAIQQHPDIILLDIIMPMMNGYEFRKKLMEDPWGQTVPVVYLTNITDESDIAGSIGGSLDYLVKAHWSLDDIEKFVTEKLHELHPQQ